MSDVADIDFETLELLSVNDVRTHTGAIVVEQCSLLIYSYSRLDTLVHRERCTP